MKILHIAPSYYPAFKYGGPIESVHLLNKALVKKGVKVDVFTTNAGLENRSDIKINEWVMIDGVRVKYFPYYFYEHYTFSPQLFFSTLKEVKKYDLVHITAIWNFSILAGSLASIFNKKPFIVSPRGSLYEEAINLKSKWLKIFYFYLAANHYLYKANALHFTTKDEKNNLAHFIRLKNKPFIIPNGIDLAAYEQLPPKGLFKEKYTVLKNKKCILFLGRLNRKKGLDILVNAFKQISKDYQNIFLVIAGPDENDYKISLERKLGEYHLLDRTIFTGMLLGRDKLSVYIDADVFVLPSYSENFGMTVIESMACGTPVVISNKVGVCEEIQQNNAGVVVNLNAESLSKGIRSLLDNPHITDEIVINAKRLTKETYDINMIANMMIDAYKEVLDNAGK